MENEKQCSNCVAWDGGDSDEGLCRRYAPRVVAPYNPYSLGDYDRYFPITADSDWCFEFVEKGK